MTERLVPPTGGGSIPTPSLQNLQVLEDLQFDSTLRFTETHHYTHSVKGITPLYCFLIRYKPSNQIWGAAIFGIPAQIQTLDKYSDRGKWNLLELRRLVLLDEAPRNSESYTLGVMFRLLSKKGIQRILSYADPNEKRLNHPDGKHTGLIYRATGFHKVKEAGRTKAIWWNGRRYPIRNLDQYNNYHSLAAVNRSLVDYGLTWDTIPKDQKILREEKYKNQKRWVWVPKIPEERIEIAKKLHKALADGSATFRTEDGKIAYVKDLEKGMPYFDPPRKRKLSSTDCRFLRKINSNSERFEA